MARRAALSRRLLLAGTVSIVLAGCAGGPSIRRDVRPDADFTRYRTFGFFAPLATDRPNYESVLTARLKQATRRELEARGYVYREADPDLLLNFFANVRERQEIRSWPVSAGYYGYRRGYWGGLGYGGVETITYREGTLTIDLVDAGQRKLVWEATAEGRVSDEALRDPGAAIDAAVTEMLAPLPVAAERRPGQ